ncbi:hypothetical protein ACFC8F_26695 [Streptomyces hydrogenans]|uniref:hypothetical protein n=1 Tax=Streptomyces hydrogenans TaxID=1873719 RepID=UPI0035E2F2FE
MRTRQRFRAAVVALPLLLAVAGCQSGAGKAGGSEGEATSTATSPSRPSVFDVPVPKQPAAAGDALADSGTAAFTTTVTYTTAGGRAVERTTGVLDWKQDAARAERVVQVPTGFPAAVADELDLTPGRYHYAVEGNEVAYRRQGGTWLRYAASDPKEFADSTAAVLGLAGDAAPWGRTLAEVLKVSFAVEDREVPGGGHRYRTQVDGLTAESVLPPAVVGYASGWGPTQTVVVDLDRQGRLVRAEADYGKLLVELHGKGALRGLTGLRVELALTGHGRPVTALVPATERFEAARTVLTLVDEVEPGDCASTDTGLGHVGVVRVVPCGSGADLRVFGQRPVDEVIRDAGREVRARRLAAERCGRDFRAAPAAWTAGARPAGAYRVSGDERFEFVSTGAGTTVQGHFTCYVTLR